MAGLLDLISAPTPGRARGLLSDLVAPAQDRLRGLLSDPSGFLRAALSDVVPTDQQALEQLSRYRMPISQDYAMGPSEYDNKMRDIALAGITRQELFQDTMRRVGGGSYADDLKEQTRLAKKAYSDNKELFDNAHRNQQLDFEVLPVDALKDLVGKTKIYKSPSYGKQSSEYYVGMINGEPAYIRKSNHWGKFGTNIYEGSDDALKLGLVNDAFDPYGRVGKKYYEWLLTGGDGSARNSQAGFIPLSKLPK